MPDDHLQRTAVLETEMKAVKDETHEIKEVQSTHGESLARIEMYIAEQTGELRIGKWIISGVFAILLIVLGAYVKKLIG